MNVLLISQCSKRALTETRRILDQFAERRGDRTWQTAITQAGLDALRKLLRKTARKNTAVACHWIRGRNHSELLWIVGDASQFNQEGAVPTNRTERDVLRTEDENQWHSLQAVHLLTALAALVHDLGKASQEFQDRLKPVRNAWQANAMRGKNRYRHEWVSFRLFQAFVAADDDAGWLRRLSAGALPEIDVQGFENSWLHPLQRDGLDATQTGALLGTASRLPPLAQAVAWLVLSHHRLPAMPRSACEPADGRLALWHGRKPHGLNAAELAHVLGKIDADWNEPWPSADPLVSRQQVAPYWDFPHGLPVRTLAWRKRAARIAQGLLQRCPAGLSCLQDPFLMHTSRMALMLADHYYSSLRDEAMRIKGDSAYPLFANTDRATGACLQRLDEHLLGVEQSASRLVYALPGLKGQLPHLLGHRGLRKRSQDANFRWQDRAADLAAGVRQRSEDNGAFIVNMASTGSGKTLGNARIMNALSDPAKGLRCAFAIGLRTLTLQTGRSFQQKLGLGDDELAILVGGAASRELFDYYETLAEQQGSVSRQALVDETLHVVYEGNDQHPAMRYLGDDARARRLLVAPLLVCTVDHLTPAVESLRGGRQIAPMLRLMTGDLVLDEPDDFDLSDLPALTRLVHWAGLLGARVLLSSATLPPALVEGLFRAYAEGRRWYQKNRGLRPDEVPDICCLWVDESAQTHVDCIQPADFQQQHQAFVQQREARLSRQDARRLAELLPLPSALRAMDKAARRSLFAQVMRDAALRLHAAHHTTDPHSGKRISFGLVRMANIDPLVDVALALFQLGAPDGVQIHLCVYHSQFPLFLRSAIEHRLDTVLNRHDDMAVFDLPEVRSAINSAAAQDQLFVVLGSPVSEVGRDHDYDWAVVEPSSMRSLIQLAGRVRRHRQTGAIQQANLVICNSNLRAFERPGQPAFCRPGFESLEFPLTPHRLDSLLSHLLDKDGRFPVDARPRILARPVANRQPVGNLVDLEHIRMEAQMLPPAPVAPVRRNRLMRHLDGPESPMVLNAGSIWQQEQIGLTGVLQQVQPFREDSLRRVDVVLRPEDDSECYALFRVAEGDRKWQELYARIEDNQNHRVPDDAVRGNGIEGWGDGDVMAIMASQADAMGLTMDDFALRYARVTLPANEQGWRWHPLLGFSGQV